MRTDAQGFQIGVFERDDGAAGARFVAVRRDIGIIDPNVRKMAEALRIVLAPLHGQGHRIRASLCPDRILTRGNIVRDLRCRNRCLPGRQRPEIVRQGDITAAFFTVEHRRKIFKGIVYFFPAVDDKTADIFTELIFIDGTLEADIIGIAVQAEGDNV